MYKNWWTKYNFNRFLFPLKFIQKIHNYEIILDEAIEDQTELGILIKKLNNDYNPRSSKKAKEKIRVLEYARKLSDARDNISDFFENGTFPYKGNACKTKKEESEEESKENKLEKIKDDCNKFLKYIENEWKGINYELFKKHFDFVAPTVLTKTLYEKNKIKRKTIS